MRFRLKLLAIVLVLAALFGAAFIVWGERFERAFSGEEFARWLRELGALGWLAAVGLLVSDLALPIPATGVMAALGAVYGLWVGAAVGTVGSTLSGVAAYWVARAAGGRRSTWLAGEHDLERFRAFFDRWGGFAVIVSRWLPILPEVVAVLAGLARMRFSRFLVALLLGTIPVSVVFAWVGAVSAREPWWGLLVAVLVPAALWPLFLRFVPRVPERATPAP